MQVDGIPMLSCTMLAASCEGQEITTIEGVSEHGSLAAIQKAYGDWGGAQCGFCTPGFIMTVKHLLAVNPEPTEEEIRGALSGNLCRCTGYSQMYQAIKAAIVAEQKGVAAASAPALRRAPAESGPYGHLRTVVTRARTLASTSQKAALTEQ